MKKHELTAGKITAMAAVIGLATACIYLLLAVGAGSTEYDCQAKDSCSKTIVRRCRRCDLQSSTVAGILGEVRSSTACKANSFKSVQKGPGGPSPP